MTTESLVTLWVTIASTFTTFSSRSASTLIVRCHADPDHLTHVLPQLGKALDQSLASGVFHPISSFRTKKGWNTPNFLHEYFSLIFDKEGYIRELADPIKIRELRTLLFLFYKLEVAFTPKQVEEASQKFKEVDSLVKVDFTDEQIERLRPYFQELFPEDPFDIRPHHSNGATADGFTNVQKVHTTRHIPSLFKVYGPQYFFNTRAHANMSLASGQFVTSLPTSKVAFVPKDSRGPRTICMEPHELMFIQKGLQYKLYNHLETPGNPGYKKINFTDQTINQHLAYLGSLDGSLATIDLKDASDMVSWALISRLCKPDWQIALQATRSPIATLPSGEKVHLNKYAPMGSALCFPIEAILFYSIARTITKDVWVYGDDIIVPNIYAGDVIIALQEYGLIVNQDKSLFTGFFRESCGGDYYKGHNITPLRIKKLDLVSIVALANNFAECFTEASGLAIIEWYESISHNIILRLSKDANVTRTGKTVHVHCPLIAFLGTRDNTILFPRKWNKDLHLYEIRSLTVVSQPLKQSHLETSISEYNELFNWFTNVELSPDPKEREFVSEILASVTPYQNYKVGLKTALFTRVKINKPKVCFRWAGFVPVS